MTRTFGVAERWTSMGNMLRLLVLWTAWTIDNSSTQETRTDIATVKFTMAKVLREVSFNALHIHGALGTTDLTPLLPAKVSGTLHAIRDAFPEVRVLRSSDQVGPGGGRNKLVSAAQFEFVASFDDDSYPIDSDYFARARKVFDRFPEASVICAAISEVRRARRTLTGL